MEAQIKVFDTHTAAVHAVELLIDKGFDPKSISLIGKAEVADDHIHVRSNEALIDAPAFLGAGTGAVIGLLTGLGVFVVPGFGVIYGAGAIIGAIAGFDIGVVGGGLATILVSMGLKKDHVVKYQEHLHEGKFLLMFHGDQEQIKKAEAILK